VHQVAPSQDVEPQDGNAAHGRSREEL
jgi:hypothetical protein